MNLAVVTLGLGFPVQQVVFSNQYFTGNFGSVTTIDPFTATEMSSPASFKSQA